MKTTPLRPALLLLLFLFVIIVGNAAESYRVIAGTLNVRSAANVHATVVGKLKKGESVEVIALEGDWAQIRYSNQSAYVAARYLQKNETAVSSPVKKTSESRWNKNLLSFQLPEINLPLFPVLLGLAFLICIPSFFMRDQIKSRPGYFWITSLLFLTLCIVEFLYFKSASNPIWFCTPDEVGWIMTIIDFFLFGAFAYYQLLLFSFLMVASSGHGGNSYDFRVGYIAWGVGLVAVIICNFFFKEYINFVIGAFAIAQLIQLGMIVYFALREKGKISYMLYTLLLYIVGSIATVVVLFSFLSLLIIVLLVLLVLSLFGNSTSACCGNCRTYNGGYCSYRQTSVSSNSYCNKHQY